MWKVNLTSCFKKKEKKEGEGFESVCNQFYYKTNVHQVHKIQFLQLYQRK